MPSSLSAPARRSLIKGPWNKPPYLLWQEVLEMFGDMDENQRPRLEGGAQALGLDTPLGWCTRPWGSRARRRTCA